MWVSGYPKMDPCGSEEGELSKHRKCRVTCRSRTPHLSERGLLSYVGH